MELPTQRATNAMYTPTLTRKAVPWLVEGLFLKGKFNAVLGPEKTGKSRLLGYLLAHMLAAPDGGPVLWEPGERVVRSRHTGFKRVLYLNAEETVDDIFPRITDYARAAGHEPTEDWGKRLTAIEETAMSFNFRMPQECAAFEARYLAPREYDVIIIDPFANVHDAAEKDNDEIKRVAQVFKKVWCIRYGISVILVHHTGKLDDDRDDLTRMATWSRGASYLPTLLDYAVCMRTMAENEDWAQRQLKRIGRSGFTSDLTVMDYGDPKGFRVMQKGS